MAAPATYTELADLDAATSAATTDSVLLQTGELLPISELRKTLDGSYVIYVPPSGESDGRDGTAIQAAIDAIQAACLEYWQTGVVLLSGVYRVGDVSITCGAVNTASRVSIQGMGVTCISRVGSASSKYLFKFYGGSSGVKPFLSNVMVKCNYLCRGILCATVPTVAIMQNVHVYQSTEVGIDMIDSCCCNLYSVYVQQFRGFALRLYGSNACHIDSLVLHTGYAMYSTNQGTITDAALAEVGMTDGIASVLANAAYPTAEEDWPATDDTSCTDLQGNAFTTTDAQRAAIYIENMYGTTFSNLTMENLHYLDYPLVYMGALAHGNVFVSIYEEDIRNRHEHFLLNGAKYNQFSNVFLANLPSAADCECFIRCKGVTRANAVRRLVGWSGITDHIVILDGGTHTANTCVECATYGDEIASADWIGETGSPTVSATWDDTFESVN
jgi:hypothetical protein